MLSGDGTATLTEDDRQLAHELAAELAQNNKSLVEGDHTDTNLMTRYLYSTTFDLNTNSKHSSQTSNHINDHQVINIYVFINYAYIIHYVHTFLLKCVLFRSLVQTI